METPFLSRSWGYDPILGNFTDLTSGGTRWDFMKDHAKYPCLSPIINGPSPGDTRNLAPDAVMFPAAAIPKDTLVGIFIGLTGRNLQEPWFQMGSNNFGIHFWFPRNVAT